VWRTPTPTTAAMSRRPELPPSMRFDLLLSVLKI
jgi:hypothetical protein